MNMLRTPPAPDASAAQRLVERGLGLLRHARPADAALLLSRAAALPGATAEAHGLLAEALMRTGEHAAALPAADAALARSDAPALRLLRAQIRRALDQMEGAMDDAAAAVMAEPGSREARLLLATYLSEGGRHDEAIFLFHQLLEAEPGNAQHAAMLAVAMLRAGRHGPAAELFAYAQSLAPGAGGLALPRAQNAMLAGDAAEAVAVIEEALLRHGPEAALYGLLGLARQRLRQPDLAAAAFIEAARLDPSNSYLQHLGAASTPGAEAPLRATDGYVTEVFDGYASRFESALFALGYRVPGLILKLIEGQGYAPGGRHVGDVLDLGCGTGLMGAALHDMLAGRLVGVDLSPGMLAEARAKEIYTELRCAELCAALAEDGTRYDFVLLSDVLCYFGPLQEVLGAAALRLNPGGLIILTVEAGAGEPGWELQGNARYRHAPDHLRGALTAAGLDILEFREETLRWEAGKPVAGLLAMARRGG